MADEENEQVAEPQADPVAEPEPAQDANATPTEEDAAGVVDETDGGAAADGPEDAAVESEEEFGWQASEYVHHHKGMAWYMGLVTGVAVLVAVSALLHLWINIVMFAVMAVAVLIYARKPPRVMTYELRPKALSIDGKEFMYTEFKSFGVLPDAEWHTIDLEPTRRFSPRITMLFGDDDFQSIVGHLELHLPRVDRKPDFVERATRYLRF